MQKRNNKHGICYQNQSLKNVYILAGNKKANTCYLWILFSIYCLMYSKILSSNKSFILKIRYVTSIRFLIDFIFFNICDFKIKLETSYPKLELFQYYFIIIPYLYGQYGNIFLQFMDFYIKDLKANI